MTRWLLGCACWGREAIDSGRGVLDVEGSEAVQGDISIRWGYGSGRKAEVSVAYKEEEIGKEDVGEYRPENPTFRPE